MGFSVLNVRLKKAKTFLQFQTLKKIPNLLANFQFSERALSWLRRVFQENFSVAKKIPAAAGAAAAAVGAAAAAAIVGAAAAAVAAAAREQSLPTPRPA